MFQYNSKFITSLYPVKRPIKDIVVSINTGQAYYLARKQSKEDVVMSKINFSNGILIQSDGDVSVQDVFPGSVPLTEFFNQTLTGDYGSKGIGLTDTGNGVIDMTGQVPADATIVKAFLYWEVLRDAGVAINLNGMPIVGQSLGTVDVLGLFVDGFRYDVTGIANKTMNNLTNFPKESSLPLLSFGASLIIVYSRNDLPCKTVIINNGLQLFNNQTVVSTFKNFTAVGTPPQSKTTYIVGNGGFDNNSAIFNAATLVGPNPPAFTSAEGPFWDTLNLSVSSFVDAGDTMAIASVQANNPLIWITQAFSVTAAVCPERGIKFF